MNSVSSHPVGVGPLMVRFPSRVIGLVHAVARRGALIAGGVAAIAILLRCFRLDAVFESSDEVAMAYLVRHSYGMRWIFAHDYGPVLAVLQRGFAEMLSWAGLPIAEASARWPAALAGLGQVAVTYPLLRRMHCPRDTAAVGTLCCAVLPMMVADAHYTWAYRAVWLLTGTTALWATLAWMDERRGWQLLLAGVALMLHCLSNCYAFALPLTLLVAWIRMHPKTLETDRLEAGPTRVSGCAPSAGRSRRPAAALAFALPCLAALAVIVLSWWWTGQGQVGHLIAKREAQVGAWSLHRIWQWAALWRPLFGYGLAPVAAAGMILGAWLLRRAGRRDDPRGRLALLGLWAWASVLPLVLVVDPGTIGHAGAYLIEAVYAGALLGTCGLCGLRDRLAQHRYARAGVGICVVCVLGLTAFGAADDCYAAGRWQRLTGVHAGWGYVRPDTGIKAAGWYVRQHVPMEAVVMAVHTNVGMEVPVAEYYLGRGVVAGYDLQPTMLRPVLSEMRDMVDVVILSAPLRDPAEGLEGFEHVCTLKRNGSPVRFIHARRELALPRLEIDVSSAGAAYDRRYTPRRVPVALPASPAFDAALRRYQQVVRQLKQGAGMNAHPKAPDGAGPARAEPAG